MRKNRLRTLWVSGWLLLPGLLMADREGQTPYREMSEHYEAVRLALLADSMEGVVDRGKALEDTASKLQQNLSAELAGVSAENLDALAGALEEIEVSALQLAQSSDLTAAREALFELTKPMARYRKLAGDQETVVAYCSMAQKAWIQPEGELGNPYYGHEMPTCGEIVGE